VRAKLGARELEDSEIVDGLSHHVVRLDSRRINVRDVVILQRCCEPQPRSSRPSQQGLGLELYVAFEIGRAHGGELKVEQTRFTFRMPRWLR